MLGKLLKYDLKKLGKELLIGYIVLFIAAIVTRIFFQLINVSMIFIVPYNMMNGITIILIVGIILFTMFAAIKNHYKSFYKDEAYLVNTLPVRKSNILLSKILSTVVFGLISLISFFSSLPSFILRTLFS